MGHPAEPTARRVTPVDRANPVRVALTAGTRPPEFEHERGGRGWFGEVGLVEERSDSDRLDGRADQVVADPGDVSLDALDASADRLASHDLPAERSPASVDGHRIAAGSSEFPTTVVV